MVPSPSVFGKLIWIKPDLIIRGIFLFLRLCFFTQSDKEAKTAKVICVFFTSRLCVKLNYL
jgi:hypothetical protein